jgi:hypothetical protein
MAKVILIKDLINFGYYEMIAMDPKPQQQRLNPNLVNLFILTYHTKRHLYHHMFGLARC